MKKVDKLKVVDLFAGAGGFSLAANNADCEVVFAVENDGHAAATYRHNFCRSSQSNTTVLFEESILDLCPELLGNTYFSENEECDLLLGGPPCQGFSSHRINNAGVDDPRNALIYSYFGFVRALRPRAFLMENVPGLLWPRHANYLEEFYSQAKDAGYKVFDPIKIDARDYGVPQRRQRVFVLGLQQSIATDNFIWPPTPSHSSEVTNNGIQEWNSCQSVFSNPIENDPNSIHMNHGPELIEAFQNTPPNGGSRKDSGRMLPCHKNHDGHKDVYGRIDPVKPAPTMTTACINPSKGRFVHPTKHHGITARQAARIQTFPDDFIFQGGLTAAGRQIGNAVPVLLGEVLINSIKIMLTEKSKEKSAIVPELYREFA